MTKTVNRELINYKTSAPTFRSGLKHGIKNANNEKTNIRYICPCTDFG